MANLSIGQGALEATPLQVACLVAAIANDGIAMPPNIVSRLLATDGRVQTKYVPPSGQRVMSSQTASRLRGMMTQVTTIGTGQDAYVENGGAAGKTGTAETGKRDNQGKNMIMLGLAAMPLLIIPRLSW